MLDLLFALTLTACQYDAASVVQRAQVQARLTDKAMDKATLSFFDPDSGVPIEAVDIKDSDGIKMSLATIFAPERYYYQVIGCSWADGQPLIFMSFRPLEKDRMMKAGGWFNPKTSALNNVYNHLAGIIVIDAVSGAIASFQANLAETPLNMSLGQVHRSEVSYRAKSQSGIWLAKEIAIAAHYWYRQPLTLFLSKVVRDFKIGARLNY